MTIRNKLALLGGSAVSMLALMIALQAWTAYGIERRLQAIRIAHEQWTALTTVELNLLRELQETSEVVEYGVEHERQEVAQARELVHSAVEQLARNTQAEAELYGLTDRTREELRRVEEVRRIVADVEGKIDRLLAKTESAATQGEEAPQQRLSEIDQQLESIMQVSPDDELAEAVEAEQEELAEIRQARILAIAPPVAGAVVLLLLLRRILHPLALNLSLLSAATARIAAGDMNTPVPVLQKDELGALAGSFNAMLDGLRQRDQLARQKDELEAAKVHLSKVAAELDRSNRELESFAQVVSHDLRAPLRAMTNYSRFLQEDCAPELGETARQYVTGIAESAKRMDDLVLGLLEYSRIGRVQLDPEQVDVGALLDRVISTLRLRDRADVALPNEVPQVWGRPLRLEQIFSNLLDNAVKYQRKGLRPVVAVEWADRGEALEFAVRDNGIGIDSKHTDKLFRMFQRLHSQEEYEGTGIGLAIVKKAVEEHGGRIWVESAPGQGSVFRFTVPKPARA